MLMHFWRSSNKIVVRYHPEFIVLTVYRRIHSFPPQDFKARHFMIKLREHRMASLMFEPILIGNVEIKNRFVHSATHEAMSADNERITDELIKRYIHFRFLKEIVIRTREALSDDLPVLVKLNTDDCTPRTGITPELAATYAGWLVDLKVASIESKHPAFPATDALPLCLMKSPYAVFKRGQVIAHIGNHDTIYSA
jgi:2,4-dienoyl-CoA reductase-like NADH-dependent reductase (Old Yellow Enzyme family)